MGHSLVCIIIGASDLLERLNRDAENHAMVGMNLPVKVT
jgi:hypothetical protein